MKHTIPILLILLSMVAFAQDAATSAETEAAPARDFAAVQEEKRQLRQQLQLRVDAIMKSKEAVALQVQLQELARQQEEVRRQLKDLRLKDPEFVRMEARAKELNDELNRAAKIQRQARRTRQSAAKLAKGADQGTLEPAEKGDN